MDGWMDRWRNEVMDEQMNKWIANRRMDRWRNEVMDEQMNRWMDKEKNGQMEG